MTPPIDYNTINMTPYEFDKALIESSDTDLFIRDEKGRIQKLDRDVYARAAMNLFKTIYGDK